MDCTFVSTALVGYSDHISFALVDCCFHLIRKSMCSVDLHETKRNSVFMGSFSGVLSVFVGIVTPAILLRK